MHGTRHVAALNNLINVSCDTRVANLHILPDVQESIASLLPIRDLSSLARQQRAALARWKELCYFLVLKGFPGNSQRFILVMGALGPCPYFFQTWYKENLSSSLRKYLFYSHITSDKRCVWTSPPHTYFSHTSDSLQHHLDVLQFNSIIIYLKTASHPTG